MGLFDKLNSFDKPEADTKRNSYQHAPMRYCGNKMDSLGEILPRLPYLDTFVDVFGGSGQVLFSRKRSKLEVYNDRNSGVSAFYRVLQNGVLLNQLVERIHTLQHSRELFYAFKDDLKNPDLDLVDRAVKWYYNIQVSFGGKGIEFGRVKKPDSPMYNKLLSYLDVFPHFHGRLKGVQIENLDWRDCITDYDTPNTVFYLDPPYWESNQYEHNMSKLDHMRMCELIWDSKGHFALSGYANELYDKYPWDDIHIFEVQENFTPSEHGHKSRATKRKEYLWTKEATH